MDFGVAYTTGKNFTEVLWAIRRAEELGFSYVGLVDSPYNYMNVYPYLGAVAVNTSQIRLGPYVTNPLTRHPSVTASAIVTVDVLSGGRAFLGIGRGDSAVKHLGWKPASWGTYRQAVTDIRSWTRGNAVTVDAGARPVQLKYAHREVPIWLGVFGPRGARVAGELAECGTTECAEPGAVKWFASETQAAAQAAGRGTIDFEVSIATYVASDIAKARDRCRWNPETLSSLIWHLMRTYPLDKIPRSLTKGFEELGREDNWWRKYDWHSQGYATAEAPHDWITDEMVDRLCVVGSVEACIEKLEVLRDAGMTQFCAIFFGLDRDELDEQLRIYGEKIMPRFR